MVEKKCIAQVKISCRASTPTATQCLNSYYQLGKLFWLPPKERVSVNDLNTECQGSKNVILQNKNNKDSIVPKVLQLNGFVLCFSFLAHGKGE